MRLWHTTSRRAPGWSTGRCSAIPARPPRTGYGATSTATSGPAPASPEEEYDGVQVFAPDGDLIGRIHLPETVANLCFGGAKMNRLFIAGSQSIYSLYVEARGIVL